MRDVVNTMGDIHASSQKIADITAVINSIAFQTNILTLNAAVEAARSRGIEQIARAVGELDSTTQQNATLVNASSLAAGSLEDQAQLLAQLVAAFRLEQPTTA